MKSGKNKNISIYCLLKILPRVLSVKEEEIGSTKLSFSIGAAY